MYPTRNPEFRYQCGYHFPPVCANKESLARYLTPGTGARTLSDSKCPLPESLCTGWQVVFSRTVALPRSLGSAATGQVAGDGNRFAAFGSGTNLKVRQPFDGHGLLETLGKG